MRYFTEQRNYVIFVMLDEDRNCTLTFKFERYSGCVGSKNTLLSAASDIKPRNTNFG